MLVLLKIVMRLVAASMLALVVLMLHYIMPATPLLLACWYIAVICVVLGFGFSVGLASLVIGSSPRRSRLGQKLRDKVDQQKGGSGEIYETLRKRAAERQASGEETTVRTQGTERRG